MGYQGSVRRLWMTGMCLLVMLLVVRPGLASVEELTAALDTLPEKAPLAIVVPNAKRFSDKLGQLAKTLGIPSPEMNDMLGSFKNDTGMAQGLREDGPVVFAITDTSWFEKQKDALAQDLEMDQDSSPPMVGLIPTSDADALMKTMSDLREEDGLMVGTDKGGKIHYMKSIAGFVLLADDKQVALDFTSGKVGTQWLKDAGAIAGKSLDDADILVIADMRKLAPSLIPMIEAGMKQFNQKQNEMGQMQPGMGDRPADMAMLQTIMSLYAQAGTTLVRDTHVVMLAANISDKGIRLSHAAQFKPDSFLGKALKNGSPAAALLSKAVNQNYLFASSINTKGIDLKSLLGEAQTQLAKVSKDAKESQMGWMLDMFKDMIPVYENVTGLTQTMYLASQPQMGTPLFNVVSIIESSDAKGFRSGLKKAMAALNNVKMAAPAGPGPGMDGAVEGISYTTSYTDNALQIEGVNVDQFAWQMQLPPAAMENNPALPFMMMMGAMGQTGYVAQSGNFIVSTTTTDTAILGSSLKMLSSSDGLGSDKLIAEARRSALPENAMMEGYFNLAGLATLANSFIPMMGMPPIQVPADLPPVAMGVSLNDSALVGHTHVPMSVMTFVRDTVQQMQGGPQQQPQSGSAPRRRQGPGNAPPF